MAREPIAGMIDKNVPSQLDPEDLAAEVELELPGSMDDNIVAFEGVAEGMDIEMTPDEDGGVTIDFDPQDQRGKGDDFYMNLAEEIPDRELSRIAGELMSEFDANKSGRQEWEDAYANGLELLGFSYEERALPELRTPCSQRLLHNSKRKRLTSCCQRRVPCELLSWEPKQGKKSSRPSA